MNAIAIVDDTPAVAEAVACMLKVFGVRDARIYNSPQKLLDEMVSGFRPRFVISDFFMPGMNGIELLDAIHEKYGSVSGIIMTGDPDAVREKQPAENTYPVLCKGRPDFFHDLMAVMGNHGGNGKRILSPAAGARPHGNSAAQCKR